MLARGLERSRGRKRKLLHAADRACDRVRHVALAHAARRLTLDGGAEAAETMVRLARAAPFAQAAKSAVAMTAPGVCWNLPFATPRPTRWRPGIG